jgi:hypothetical protein
VAYDDAAFSPFDDHGDGKGKATMPAELPLERIFQV